MRLCATLRRVLVGLLFTALCAGLSAQVPGSLAFPNLQQAPQIEYRPTGGTVVGRPVTAGTATDFNRLLSKTGSGTTGSDFERLLVQDQVKARAGQTDFDMLLKRSVSRRAIEKAGAAVARSLPGIATGIAVWELVDEIRVRPDEQGGLKFDDGTPQVQTPTPFYITGGQQFTKAATKVSSCNLHGAQYTAYGSCGTGYGVVISNGAACQAKQQCAGYVADAGGAQGISTGTESSLKCPASIDASNPANSVPEGLPPGFDGKCRTGRYTTPQSDDQVADKRLLVPTSRLVEQYLGELDKGGAPQPDGGPGDLSGPASVNQPGTITTTHPDGSVTTSSPPSWSITYGSPTSNAWSWSTTTIVNNPGGGTTTTTAPPPEKVITCGLPGTPQCKIDETGTPSAPVKDTAGDIAAKTAPVTTIIANPSGTFGEFPTISWSFALPTGCGTIPVPAFSPFLSAVDVCQFQPMFHSIMSVVWMIGGLFGAISIFWRDQLQAV